MSTIILFRGKAGVGKTTLSSAVSQRLGIPVIQKDHIYDELVPLESQHQIRNDICEAILQNILLTNIQTGASLILDHSVHHPDHVRRFRKWVRAKGGHLISIVLNCSDRELYKKRFNKRSENPKPNNLITDLDEIEKYYGTLHTEPFEGELVLDTVNQLDQLVEEALKWFENNKR